MGTPRKPTIVVAEEFALVRDSIAALCESSGVYEVIGQAGDGAAAVEQVISLGPDIAVLDLALPKLESLQAMHKIRRIAQSTHIVAISTRRDPKTVIEVLRGGANGFVLKAGPGRHLLEAFEHVRGGGIYVTPILAMDKLFVPRKPRGDRDPMDRLSTREFQVFVLLIDGIRAKEIAARLEVSPKTVDTYRASLMRKLDIHDVAGLVKFAITRSITSAV